MKKKRNYVSPLWLQTLDPSEDPTIDMGGSQGTSGYDSMWTFADDIGQDDLDMIDLNCDDFDLQDMDRDGNYIITNDEFQIWLEERGGW